MVSPITQMQIAFPIRLDRQSARDKQWWLALGCRLLETRLLQRLRFKYGEIYTVSVSREVWRSVGLVWTRKVLLKLKFPLVDMELVSSSQKCAEQSLLFPAAVECRPSTSGQGALFFSLLTNACPAAHVL